jgi:hypothetical protein
MHVAPFAHRADGELLLKGCPELVHQHDVDLPVQRFGDHLGHGDRAPGNPQNQRILASITLEPLREKLRGFDAARKERIVAVRVVLGIHERLYRNILAVP